MKPPHSAKTMSLVARDAPAGDEPSWNLVSPAPGRFTPSVSTHSWLDPADSIGTLSILGRVVHLVVPNHCAGAIRFAESAGASSARDVDYGQLLAVLTPSVRPDAHTTPRDAGAPGVVSAQGLVFRAPTSGRYYGRPSPDKPAFVALGSELHTGTTICLLEVMKTFNRITYRGAPARVRQLLVADGDDVNAGDPLLALDATSAT